MHIRGRLMLLTGAMRIFFTTKLLRAVENDEAEKVWIVRRPNGELLRWKSK